VRVDDANGATPIEANITPAGATGYVNCVVTGSSDQNLIACYSNYNVMNVWVSTNGGTSWTGIDGNLPNMPVRWALFHPDDKKPVYGKRILLMVQVQYGMPMLLFLMSEQI